MKHSINKEKSLSLGTVIEKVYFHIYGRYSVNSTKYETTVYKTDLSKDCIYGHDFYETNLFDGIGSRKKAYHTSNSIILSHLRGTNHYSKTITDDKKVPIYKKKNRKNK